MLITLTVSGDATFSSATVTDDFAVDTDTLLVDVSGDSVGINVGTTLDAAVGLVKGGNKVALRIQGGGSVSMALTTCYCLMLETTIMMILLMQ